MSWKYLEGSGHGLIKVLSRCLLGGGLGNARVRTHNFLCASLSLHLLGTIRAHEEPCQHVIPLCIRETLSSILEHTYCYSDWSFPWYPSVPSHNHWDISPCYSNKRKPNHMSICLWASGRPGASHGNEQVRIRHRITAIHASMSVRGLIPHTSYNVQRPGDETGETDGDLRDGMAKMTKCLQFEHTCLFAHTHSRPDLSVLSRSRSASRQVCWGKDCISMYRL
jgi:hypothetical protein